MKCFLNLNQVNLCHVSEGETSEHCRVEDGKTKMLIPRINLYTNETNDEKYVSSLTFDLLKNEIVRYKCLGLIAKHIQFSSFVYNYRNRNHLVGKSFY